MNVGNAAPGLPGESQPGNHIGYLALFAVAMPIVVLYAVPILVSLFSPALFLYTNGWDEESYLTLQGIAGRMLSPGYVSMLPLYVPLRMGISGAMINVALDLSIPLFTIIVLFKFFTRYCSDKVVASAASVLSVFGTLFLNNANPVLRLLNIPFNYGSFVSGWESMPPILRTPNPQISYGIIALAVLLATKYKRPALLIVPIPFLYFFSMTTYFFFVAAMALLTLFSPRLRPGLSWFCAVVVPLCFLATGLIIVDKLFVSQDLFVQNSGHLFRNRTPQIPVGAVVCAFFLAVSVLADRVSIQPIVRPFCLKRILILAFLTCVCVTNLHVLTGWNLAPKNVQDYGIGPLVSIVSGLTLVWISSQFKKILRVLILVLLFGNWLLLADSVNFKILDGKWKILSGVMLKQEDLDFYLDHPSKSLFRDKHQASRIAYATGGLFPTFAFQMSWPFIANQCPGQNEIDRMALEFIKASYPADYQHFAEQASTNSEVLNKFYDAKIPPLSFCDSFSSLVDFRLIEPEKEHGWIEFP